MAKKTEETFGSMDDETPSEPAPEMSQLDKLILVVEKMALIIASGQGSTPRNEELMLKLTEAMERISETSLRGSKMIAEETRRALRPSNEQIPGISVFNRRGVLLADYEKPKLKCIMMVPWLVEWESCTREEVELLNLLEPGSYELKKNDGSKLQVTVNMTYKVGGVIPSRLTIEHETAFNNDNFRNHLPLSEMLRFLLRQHSPEIRRASKEVLTDEEEEALIEAGQLTVSV